MEQLLTLLKSTPTISSPIVVDLIKRATANPKIFGYAELYHELTSALHVGGGVELSPAATQWVEYLRMFTYGSWADYKAHISDSIDESLPTLAEPQVRKLKQLTLLKLCATSNAESIPYVELSRALELGSASDGGVDELEQLVIETIYSGKLTAKLDTKNQALEVFQVTAGSDVDEKRLDEIIAVLDQWDEHTRALLEQVEASIDVNRQVKSQREAELTEALKTST